MGIAGDLLEMPTSKKAFKFRLYPTSWPCVRRAGRKSMLTVGQRDSDNPSCPTHHQQDERASKNLKAEGMGLLLSRAIGIVPEEQREVTLAEIVADHAFR